MTQSGMKCSEKKPMLELVPAGTMTAIAEVMTQVVRREENPYKINSWRAVRPAHTYVGALLRHIEAVMGGEQLDPSTGFSHISHILCCASILSWFERNGVDISLPAYEEHPSNSVHSVDVRRNFEVSQELRKQ
jgi:hypothetical protein